MKHLHRTGLASAIILGSVMVGGCATSYQETLRASGQEGDYITSPSRIRLMPPRPEAEYNFNKSKSRIYLDSDSIIETPLEIKRHPPE